MRRPSRLHHAFSLPALAAAALLAAPLAAQDRDGDTIPDAIETEAWYLAAGGSPDRKDVWLECDWMPGTLGKRGLLRRRAEGVFRRAPVAGGIRLHLTFDETIPFEPQWGNVGTDEGFLRTWERVQEEHERSFDARPFRGANAETMRPHVSYCLFVESIGGDGLTGYAFGVPGDIFVVALGQYGHELLGIPRGRAEASILLHELGHNLGLSHGGRRPLSESVSKPHRLSVMSYIYTFGFYREVDGRAQPFDYWDYSRARSSNLDERRLNERQGIALPPEAAFADTPAGEALLGSFRCPDLERRFFHFNGPVDFDCDGTISPGTVRSDVTADGSLTALGRGQVDWDELVFDGSSADLPVDPSVILLDPREEPGRAELEELLGRPLHLESAPERR